MKTSLSMTDAVVRLTALAVIFLVTENGPRPLAAQGICAGYVASCYESCQEAESCEEIQPGCEPYNSRCGDNTELCIFTDDAKECWYLIEAP